MLNHINYCVRTSSFKMSFRVLIPKLMLAAGGVWLSHNPTYTQIYLQLMDIGEDTSVVFILSSTGKSTSMQMLQICTDPHVHLLLCWRLAAQDVKQVVHQSDILVVFLLRFSSLHVFGKMLIAKVYL